MNIFDSMDDNCLLWILILLLVLGKDNGIFCGNTLPILLAVFLLMRKGDDSHCGCGCN